MAQQIKRSQLSDPWRLLAFGFGTGLSPVAPATVAALAAIPAYLLFASFPAPLNAALVVSGFTVGVRLCH